MAIYHLRHTKNNRSAGANVINKVAYRLRTKAKFVDYETGELKSRNHSRQREGETVIDLGLYGAPTHMKDPMAWAEAIEIAENRKKSVVCREFEVALPRELSKQEMKYAIEDFIEGAITKHGMTAHAVIHDSDNNPHCHILFSERIYDERKQKFGNKSRVYTQTGKDALNDARKLWADVVNEQLKQYNTRITHKSYKDLGITDVQPSQRIGRKPYPWVKHETKLNEVKRNRREELLKIPHFRKKYSGELLEEQETNNLLSGIDKFKSKKSNPLKNKNKSGSKFKNK